MFFVHLTIRYTNITPKSWDTNVGENLKPLNSIIEFLLNIPLLFYYFCAVKFMMNNLFAYKLQ